jgi:cysteine synthase A
MWDDTDAGKIDIFVGGVGTGGTITGVAEVIRLKNQDSGNCCGADCISVLRRPAGPHKIQGLGAGFVPDVLNTKIIDEVIQVTNDDSFAMARRLAKEEGILCGISSGAAVWAALEVEGLRIG